MRPNVPGEQAAERPIDVLLVGTGVGDGDGDSLADRLERTESGLRVAVESDPDAVPGRVRGGSVECVVAEHDLPGTDGLSLLETVRAASPDLPFVLLAPADGPGVAEALAAGVDDYVRDAGSPEGGTLLARRIENLVARDRARRSYREVFEKATVGLTVHDVDGEFVDANRHFCELLGYDYEEVTDLTLADVSAGEEPYTGERARELMAATVADGGPRRFEWLDETKDGDRIWVEVCLRTAEVAGHERILTSVRDVTERKRREEELEATNERLREQAERLEEFASVVSHDLRNPIEVARAHVDLAREAGDVDRLERVDEALDRMETIVDGVLTLARRGEVVGERAPVSLPEVARSAWATVATGEATLRIEEGLGAVEADREALRELLENLFRNSVDHAGEAPTVRVGPLRAAGETGGGSDERSPDDGGDGGAPGGGSGGVSSGSGSGEEPSSSGSDEDPVGGADDGPVGFFVADDGPGVAPEERERVFERGYTSESDGTGLGLAIVETIAEAHGWTVEMTESRDGGARVEVRGIDPVGEAWTD